MSTPISMFVNWMKNAKIDSIQPDKLPETDMEIGKDGECWEKGQDIEFPGT